MIDYCAYTFHQAFIPLTQITFFELKKGLRKDGFCFCVVVLFSISVNLRCCFGLTLNLGKDFISFSSSESLL